MGRSDPGRWRPCLSDFSSRVLSPECALPRHPCPGIRLGHRALLLNAWTDIPH